MQTQLSRASWTSLALALGAIGCHSTPGAGAQTHTSISQVVEASCGECQFGMDGEDCDLAVRIDGEAYYVDGSNTDDHGDAHAADGICNAIRQAVVVGEVVDGRFVASAFELLPYGGEAAPGKPRLGIALATGESGLVIDRVFEGSLAEEAGLRKGDIVKELNGRPVASMEQDALRSLLEKEALLRFSILRDGEVREVEVDLGAE